MAVQNANEVNVRLDGVLVDNVTNVSLNLTNNLVEVTRGLTNGFVERISGIKDGSLSVEGYFAQEDLNRYSLGSSVSVIFGTRTAGQTILEGIIQQIEISGGTDSAIGFSMSIQVTGEVLNYVPNYIFDVLMTRAGVDIETRAGEPIEVRTIQY